MQTNSVESSGRPSGGGAKPYCYATEATYLLDNAINKLGSLRECLDRLPRSQVSLLEPLSGLILKQAQEKRDSLVQNIDTLGPAQKRSIRFQLREILKQTGSLLCQADWQAPSTFASLCPRSSKNPERVKENLNDYNRESHSHGDIFERVFHQEFYPNAENEKSCSLCFSSGMSAYSSSLQFLRTAFPNARVVWDKNIYHECRFLVENLIASNKREVFDGASTSSISSLANADEDSVIVLLDSLYNSTTCGAPKLDNILEAMSGKKGALLIDNTMLGPFLDLKSLRGQLPEEMLIVVVESLAKFHQFGLDLVTAGVSSLFANCSATPAEFKRFRTHLGTQLSDLSAATLPTPNATLLMRRVGKMGQNADFIAKTLIRKQNTDSRFRVQFCGVSSKVKALKDSHNDFAGVHFCIEGAKEGIDPEDYQFFRSCILEQAAQMDLDLVCSTSFGFNATRLYLIDSEISSHKPFFRISCGVESEEAVTKLLELLKTSLDKFNMDA